MSPIAMSTIPSSIKKPGTYMEFNTALAVRSLPANRQRMLILGQLSTVGGSVAAGTVKQVFSDVEAAGYFGYGSLAHLMVRAALTANPYLDLSVLSLADGTTAQTWTITFATAATASGVLRLLIGNQTVEVAVTTGDLHTAIATAVNVALAARNDLPVTAAVNAGVVTLTAKTKGTIADEIDIAREIVNFTGTTVVIADGVAGAVDPAVNTALALVAGEQYDIIVSPFNSEAALAFLITHLDTVSGAMEQRPGIGVVAMDAALADVTHRAGTHCNSGRLVMTYLRGTNSPSFEVAAAMGAVIASEEDPARPLNTLELKGIHAPLITSRFTRAEQESCLANGTTPLEIGPGEKVQIVRAISTYVLNPAGIADPSLLDITTIRSLDYVRKSCREAVALRFARSKLSTKMLPRIRTCLYDTLKKLESLEIVEAVDDNKAGLIVERNAQDVNRADAAIPADVVNGLHVFAGRIDLLL